MRLARATIFVSLAALLSRILGVWRENLLASGFGALGTDTVQPLDAYYAAFRIPDFLYNLVILSVGAAIFVPLLAKEYQQHKEKINEVVNNLLHAGAVLLVAGSLLIFFTIPWFIGAFTIGFSPETRELTGNLMRIMLLSPLFFGLSSIIAGYLSIHKDFTAYTWSPLLYNLAIIAGIFFLVPLWGVYGLAWGVAGGAFLHLLVQIRPLYRRHYRYAWKLDWHMPALREVGRLAVPRMIGMSAAQINLIVDTSIATTLSAGSLTILNWTQNLQYLPIGLIGISLSVTAFTLLSDLAALDKKEKFAKTFLTTMRMILFLSIPVMVGFYLMRREIVDLILNYGKFRTVAGNLEITASALGLFIVSLVFQSLIPLLTRAFYAYQDTKTPVITSIVTVVINIAASILFAKVWGMGILGLALSFSLANIINALLLLYYLNRRIIPGMFAFRQLAPFVIKTIAASGAMGVVIFGVQTILSSLGNGKAMLLISSISAVILGGLVFLAIAKWLQIREVEEIWKRLTIKEAS